MKKNITLLMVSIITSLFSQNIQGVVFNENGEPFNSCNIVLLENGKILDYKKTNHKGEFAFKVAENNNYTIEVINPSYILKTVNIDSISNDTSLKFNLLPVLSNVEAFANNNELEPNENVEEIGDLSSLPENYKIIEAKPLKFNEIESSGFNVQQKMQTNQPTVNVNVLKEAFNGEELSESFKEKSYDFLSYFENGNIYYNVGSYSLSKQNKELLNVLALILLQDNDAVLELTAFADANTEYDKGNELAKKRVEVLISYLLAQNVPFEKLKVATLGNNVLKNGCYKGVHCSLEKHQENRRVELLLKN